MKHRAKKKAMREGKRRVDQASMEDLDDHGGKGEGFWSESSDSKSSDSSNTSDSSNSSNYEKGAWRNKKGGS